MNRLEKPCPECKNPVYIVLGVNYVTCKKCRMISKVEHKYFREGDIRRRETKLISQKHLYLNKK